MKINEINKPIEEYRNVVTPRDEIHYREMMKTLHNLELKSASDPATMAEIKRRKMELRNWAEQNLKREDKEEENQVEDADGEPRTEGRGAAPCASSGIWIFGERHPDKPMRRQDVGQRQHAFSCGSGTMPA